MSTVLTARRDGVLPRINLLPPEIAERARFKKQRFGMTGALALTVLGLAGAYAIAVQSADSAESDLQTQRSEGDAISQKSAQYADIPRVEAQTQAAESSLQSAMGQDVRWSFFLNDVSTTIPSDVWLTSLTMTQPLAGPVGAPVAPIDPATAEAYSGPGIASITYAGTSKVYGDVARWLESQELINHLDAPYLTTSADSKIGSVEVVGFTTTATVDASAYSRRYDTPTDIPNAIPTATPTDTPRGQ